MLRLDCLHSDGSSSSLSGEAGMIPWRNPVPRGVDEKSISLMVNIIFLVLGLPSS